MAKKESSQSDKKWRYFQRLSFDKKQMMRRMRKAEKATVRHAHKFILRRWQNAREVRRVIATWVVAVACLISAIGLQLYWDQQSYRVEAGDLGGTYAEALLGPVDTLDPIFAATPAEQAVSQLVFSRLMTYDTTGHLNYDAAQAVKASEDGRTYTVTLRPDITWHDGRTMTADDIIFTVDALQDPATHSQIRGWEGVKTEKVDDRTVKFSLTSPYAPFRSALTFPILPKHVLGDVNHAGLREHSFSASPVGSGPFSFRVLQDIDVAGGRRVVHLVANPSYYRGAPKLDRFQVHAYPTRDAIKKALAINEVNAADGLSRHDIKEVNSRQYTATTQAVQAGVYAFLNNESTILSDKAVRKALQYATNLGEIRSKLGGAVPSLPLPYTSQQLTGDSLPAPVAFDKTAAAKVLDEAGWKLEGDIRKKEGRELRLSVVTTRDDDYERVLETMIGQWRSLGIAVDDRVVDAADPSQNFVQSVLRGRGYDVLIYQIAIGPDPDIYAYWHSSQAVARGLNLSNYNNQVADDILSSARSNMNAELRGAKHLAFARQWVDDVPAIGLYQSTDQYVASKSVRGIPSTTEIASPENRYESVRYWTVGDRTVYRTP